MGEHPQRVKKRGLLGWVDDYFRRHRDRFLEYGVVALVVGLLIQGFIVWQGVDFLVGKRRGVVRVVGMILDLVAHPWFSRTLQIVGTLVVVGLYLQAKRDTREYRQVRKRHITYEVGEPFIERVPPSPSVKPATVRVEHLPGCQSVYLLVSRGGHADGTWDRITTCQNCGARVSDDYAVRVKEGGPVDWGVWHGQNELMDNITLGVGSFSEDRRRIYRCDVVDPSGNTYTYDAIRYGSGLFGYDPSTIQPIKDDACFYPEQTMFPDAPPIAVDGTYKVEWKALEAGPGDYPLKIDEFEIKDGRLVR